MLNIHCNTHSARCAKALPCARLKEAVPHNHILLRLSLIFQRPIEKP